MATTTSSWEYSQGPILYIDSSGFESIDDNKNFVYFYVVTYGPVEYKRKITNDKGESVYEYKYSFGVSNSERKTLGRYTFSGKQQVTKVVTHSVTEDGFKNSITKSFVIDTNAQSGAQNNIQTSISATSMLNTTNWKMGTKDTQELGWKTEQKTGYTTETRYVYEYETYYGCEYRYEWYCDPNVGYTYRVIPEWKWITDSVRVPVTERVPYTYNETTSSNCILSLKNIRKEIGKFIDKSSLILRVKTKNAIDKPPYICITNEVTTSSLKDELTCKTTGNVQAGSVLEYYIPISLINNDKYKNKDSVYITIEKGTSATKDCYITEAYVYIETETDKIPYINLIVQAYNASKEQWVDACVIPYLSYTEIEEFRNTNQHVSKNLFLPSDLPKTDSSYRIKLDTNLVAQEVERLVNFRVDVLFDQKVLPGSVEDKKLYLKNDTLSISNEIELGKIDEIKLNALGSLTYEKNTYSGFLRQGANDIHTYLKSTTFATENEANSYSKNIWFNYINSKDGNWLSNTLFASNTFSFNQTGVLKENNLEKDLITFKIPYNKLKPKSSYTILFDANVEEAFNITDILTINSSDKDKVVCAKLYSTSTYDKNKVTIKDFSEIFYSPYYKLKSNNTTELVSEFSQCKQDVELKIEINTKSISSTDKEYITICIKRNAIKNIFIKNMTCISIDSSGQKNVDIIDIYNTGSSSGRLYDTTMTLYYDGIDIKHINPLIYDDLVYLRQELDKIRKIFELPIYDWSNWSNSSSSVDKYGHMLGVNKGQPLRANHFNDVKQCCVDTYEKLLALNPPVSLNVSPSTFRNTVNLIPLNNSNASEGYVLQHYRDKNGKLIEVDEYFPEWRKIVDLLNRN